MEFNGDTKWDLEVSGSPANREAVPKLPLAHLLGLPEKCTYCITDQLTLSAVPRSDWHCTLRKLQTFTSADKTRFSPHSSFLTSLSPETSQSFMLWSSAGSVCEAWWIKHFTPPRAPGRKEPRRPPLQTEAKRQPWDKQTFWLVDNRNLICISPPTCKTPRWQGSHFVRTGFELCTRGADEEQNGRARTQQDELI